ncbi:peptidase M28 [Pontibacter diazotrophicus]|uniref:Peptidase M28 n=1 Tax=Pontibacter diazotrophicus TaxID=1400979 RepID=A0A3D8L9T2_9BACT|nr:M28 family peptidase [Pontibacter diazotrophicus]RDV14076.1 peptidase M28 [Pontibacter diazotrophicus]
MTLQADKQRLYQDVEFLTSLQPARNYRNKQSLEAASRYIYDELHKLSFDKTEYQEFIVGSGEKYRNVSALYKGVREERIIIGAHYDVSGDQPGADDNASAVAGMLETARLIDAYQQKEKLNYTLEFVGYCLEEPPFFGTDEMGSAVHARQMLSEKVPVKYMIAYEMIGYFSDAPNSQNFPDPSLKSMFPNTGNFIVIAGHSSQKEVAETLASRMQKHCTIPVYPVAFPVTNGLANLSDHRSYIKHGYNAVMVNDTSFLRNPHYHMPTDTIDTLDFERMGDVVNGVTGMLISMNEEIK